MSSMKAEELPDYLQEFKAGLDEIAPQMAKDGRKIKLPVLSQMSSSLKSKLALYGSTTAGEQERVDELWKAAGEVDIGRGYDNINSIADKERSLRNQIRSIKHTDYDALMNSKFLPAQRPSTGIEKVPMVAEDSNEYFKTMESNKSKEQAKREREKMDGKKKSSSALRTSSSERVLPLKKHSLKSLHRNPGILPAYSSSSSAANLADRDLSTINRDLLNLSNSQAQHNISVSNTKMSEAEHDEFMFKWKSSIQDELGVTVDAGFSLRRKQKKAMDLIFFKMYTGRIMAAWEDWKKYVVLANQQRIQDAGLVVTRIVWGFLGRVRARQMKMIIELAHEAELAEEARQHAHRNLMALKVAQYVKTYMRKKIVDKKRRQNLGATKFQALFRGSMARARLTRNRLENQAALVIQCMARFVKARYRVKIYFKIRDADGVLRHRGEVWAMKCRDYVRNGAAIVINKFYSVHKIKKGLKKCKYWNRIRLATIMQRYIRGFISRVNYIRLKRIRDKKRLQIFLTVSTIQKIARGYIARIGICHEKKVLAIQRKMERRAKKTALLQDPNREYKAKALATLRALHPFRYVWEISRAVKIQRYWRGHRGRRSAFRNRINDRLTAQSEKYRKREFVAVSFQKLYRGFACRLCARRLRDKTMAIRIQSLFRGKRVRKQLVKNEEKRLASKFLAHVLYGFGLKLRKFNYKRQRILQGRPAYVITSSIKKYLKKKGDILRRRVKRASRENYLSGSLASLKAISGNQVMILYESLRTPIGKTLRNECGEACPCLGPLQSLFVNGVVGKKGKTDPSVLVLNRVGPMECIKFLQRLGGVCEGKLAEKKSNKGPPKKSKKKKGGGGEEANNDDPEDDGESSLLSAFKHGLLQLPIAKKVLTMTEVDIQVNRCKDEDSISKDLSYEEFITFMNYVGAIHFQRRVVSRNDASRQAMVSTTPLVPSGFGDNVDGGESSGATLSSYFDAQDESKDPGIETETKGTPKPVETGYGSAQPQPLSSPTENSRRTNVVEKFGSMSLKPITADAKISQTRQKVIFTFSKLHQDISKFGLSLCIYVLVHLSDEPWVIEILEWLEKESRARVGIYAKGIQQLRTRQKNRVWREIMRKISFEKEELDKQTRAATLLTKIAKSHSERLKVRRIAQKFLIKYVPPDGRPYWYNPSTRAATYTKPKILADRECITISMPAAGLEYVVPCPTCKRPAEVNCTTCDESMCKECFSNLHCKGNRRYHLKEKIFFCAYCRFQMATKSCVTCFLKPPKQGTVQELVTGDRGLFCDTCFAYLHDDREMGMEVLSIEDRLSKTMLVERTKDAYLVGQSIHDEIITDHMYTDLVEKCEECLSRAASWRCEDCRQIYCSKCLIGLHSMGGPFSKHQANPLPYYTPDMHQRFEIDDGDFRMKKKMDLIKHRLAEQAQLKYIKSVIRVQAWWRMVLHGRKAKNFLLLSRRKIRHAYRARQRENRLYRNTISYQALNFVGLAQPLATDSREEQALRELPWFLRHRARQYIWKNKDDWGFYRTSRTEPRKGVPKTAFDVGEVEDLVVQAKLGGYRLPGTISVKNGFNKHTTQYDLTSIIRAGVYLRIKSSIFVCVNVMDSCEILLDAMWSEDDGEEIIYLLPSYKGEKGRRFYKALHAFKSAIINNPVVQGYAGLHANIMSRISTYGAVQALMMKKRKKMKSWTRWDKFAKLYKKRAQWAKNLITQFGGSVDVSDMMSPEQMVAAKEAEDLAKKLENEKKEQEKALARLQKNEAIKAAQAAKKKKDQEKAAAKKAARESKAKEKAGLSFDDDDTKEKDQGEGGDGDDSNINPATGQPYPEGWHHSDEKSDRKKKKKEEKKDKTDKGLGSGSDDSDKDSDDSDSDNSSEDESEIKSINTDDFIEKKGPVEQWKATEEQLFERSQKESQMSRHELASFAQEWVQYLDPLTDNEYFVNKLTNELSHVIPASVAMKEELELEEEANKRNFDEAQKRMEKLQRVVKGNRKMVIRR